MKREVTKISLPEKGVQFVGAIQCGAQTDANTPRHDTSGCESCCGRGVGKVGKIVGMASDGIEKGAKKEGRTVIDGLVPPQEIGVGASVPRNTKVAQHSEMML